jgi:hypothetical protein
MIGCKTPPLSKTTHLTDDEQAEKRAASIQITKLYAKAGRVTRNALHWLDHRPYL